MGQVELETLLRQQVHRHRITAEGVDRQHVEALRIATLQLALHLDPRIAEDDVDLGAARPGVVQEGEVRLGHPDDLRVDLVVALVVAGLFAASRHTAVFVGVRRDRAGAEPDEAHTKLAMRDLALGMKLNGQPDAAVTAVVGRRPGAFVRVPVLESVPRMSVHQVVLVHAG